MLVRVSIFGVTNQEHLVEEGVDGGCPANGDPTVMGPVSRTPSCRLDSSSSSFVHSSTSYGSMGSTQITHNADTHIQTATQKLQSDYYAFIALIYSFFYHAAVHFFGSCFCSYKVHKTRNTLSLMQRPLFFTAVHDLQGLEAKHT